MRVIKKVYFAILLLAFVFLAYQCGENKGDNSGETTSNTTASLKGNPVEGKTLFSQTCSACHGTDGKGLPRLGKDLTTSTFIQEKNDKELVSFIEQGRLASDPLNTTGVAMPPKGGNPALTEQQLADIISYLRELHN